MVYKYFFVIDNNVCKYDVCKVWEYDFFGSNRGMLDKRNFEFFS